MAAQKMVVEVPQDADPVSVLRLALQTIEGIALKYRQAIHILESESNTNRAAQIPSRQLPAGGHLPLLLPSDTMATGAVKVLDANNGRPLHIKEIVSRMIASGFRNQDPKSLKANIAKTLDRGKEFRRVAPATYGLASPADAKSSFESGT